MGSSRWSRWGRGVGGGGAGGGVVVGGGVGALLLVITFTSCWSVSHAFSVPSSSLLSFSSLSSLTSLRLPPPTNLKAPRLRALRRGLTSIYASSASTVEDLLDLVGKGLEGEYTKEESSKISDCIDRLEEVGRGRVYLEDPRLVGYYRVQYVQDVGRGRPVGGNFRYTAAGR